MTDASARPESRSRSRWRLAKPSKEKLFWGWIAYQTAKGLTTTTFIWFPLWMAWRTGVLGA
ncbi:MAG: hypothetical protein WBG08_00465 [Litorimonas sp.]